LKEVKSAGAGTRSVAQPRLHLRLHPECRHQMNESTPTPDPHSGQGMDYSEIADVQDVHAACSAKNVSPVWSRTAVHLVDRSVGLAVFFGGAYLGRYSGKFFSGEALDPYGGEMATMKKVTGPQGAEQAAELSPHDRGKKIFAANCQTCHQANGLGVAGQYPPLAGSGVYNRRLAPARYDCHEGSARTVTVKGQKFGTAVMQPWDKTLTDQKIADVLTYERSEWGNNASR